MRRRYALLFVVLQAAACAWALGPHEVALIINRDDPESRALGRWYATARAIPDVNVVEVGLPDGCVAEIAEADYVACIRDPVRSALAERGIADHVLVWAYSVGFPFRVRGSPPLSLTGRTFLGERAPDPAMVRKDGLYASPLFAGPAGPQGTMQMPRTLDVPADTLGDDRPVPGMVLGYTGERGNTLAEVSNALARAIAVEGAAPRGTVYLQTGPDPRTACRQWQFTGAQERLAVLGVACRIGPDLPGGATDVLGLLAGVADVDAGGVGYLLPGAYAEHLTSAAGQFDSAGQTKFSVWVAAGAAGTGGAVVEPFSVWQKFPAASLFVHYRAGCTLVESLAQSIACPLEILLAGDPLACPWKPDLGLVVEIEGIAEGDVLRESRHVTARVEPSHRMYRTVTWLLDGRVAGRGRVLRLDPAGIGGGAHTLRAVVARAGLVRNPVFREVGIRVDADAGGSGR